MRQAIITTLTRSHRVKATADAGSIIVEWNSALSTEENHIAAARKLAEKWEWRGVWYAGGVDNNFVFVCTEPHNQKAFAPAFTVRPAA